MKAPAPSGWARPVSVDRDAVRAKMPRSSNASGRFMESPARDQTRRAELPRLESWFVFELGPSMSLRPPGVAAESGGCVKGCPLDRAP